MKWLLRTSSLETDLAALSLRLILGGLMFYHGYQKIQMYDQILPMFTDVIGIGSKLSFNLVIFAEFFCGLLVIIGLFTRLAIIPILISFIVVFFVALKNYGFQEKELPLLFLLLCFPVFILGSGKVSIDRLIQKKRPSA